MTTIVELAKAMSAAFEGRTRANGEAFRCLKESAPVWMHEVCYAAHGDMMPDDWRYQFIEDAIDAMAEFPDDGTGDYYDDVASLLEPDTYTRTLLDWLTSRLDRSYYVDAAAQEMGMEVDTLTRIACGQLYEKRETLRLVYEALEAERDSRE